ncbi:MAG: DUF308 domain-containing protein [Spirochaetales bacterium]|nr:DUF308 domain-containing protein [Spirochaetales bacterium]
MEGTVENADNSTVLKNNWFYTFVQSCISAVIGLILLLVPKIGVVFISLVFSVYLIWVGVTQVVLAFKLSSIQRNWWVILVRGIVMLICGLVVVSFPVSFGEISVGIPLIILGLFLIFYGVLDLITRRIPGQGLTHGMSSIIMILIGVLLCLASAAAARVLFRILGATTLAGGIIQGYQAFVSRRWVINNSNTDQS